MTPWSLVAGFVPVVAFLLGLRIMDTFKLVHRTALLAALAGGFVAALLAYGVNVVALSALHVHVATLRAWIAPVSEEILKAALVAWLIHTDRVGFVVDAAVLGFGVGAGFAVAENLYYARVLHDATITLWLVRGFGTAIMHGSTTATFAVVGKALSDRYPRSGLLAFAPGLLCAVVIHAAFNQLSTSPFVTTAVLLVAMPILLLAAFDYSEGVTRGWLADSFDGEMELLERILDGDVSDTPVGRYLEALRDRFEPMVVADLFCLLTVHLELSLRAKGMLIARAAGVEVPVDERVRANLKELRHLERVVGATGRLAILPLRRRERRDLWQILLLEQAKASEARP